MNLMSLHFNLKSVFLQKRCENNLLFYTCKYLLVFFLICIKKKIKTVPISAYSTKKFCDTLVPGSPRW